MRCKNFTEKKKPEGKKPENPPKPQGMGMSRSQKEAYLMGYMAGVKGDSKLYKIIYREWLTS